MPAGLRGPVAAGTRLDRAAQQLGADLQSLCGGSGKCGKCRVRVVSGPAGLSSPTDVEKASLSAEALAAGWRLACQAHVGGDVTVDIPEENRTGGQVICKDPGAQTVVPDPLVRRWTVRVAPADIDHPTADWQRVVEGVKAAGAAAAPAPDRALLRSLASVLRRTDGDLSLFVRDDGRCIGVDGHPKRPLTGVALDIGTTSLAAYLCDLESGATLGAASAINPQVPFGEDVISRVAHATNEPGGCRQLQEAVIGGINRLVAQLSEQSGVLAEAMVDMVCVGNTCMHHLFFGIDPVGLGKSPFAPAVFEAPAVRAEELGLAIAPGAAVHFLPVVSGFVGGDTVGALLAAVPEAGEETVLLVDVGTNGEIVLVHQERMVCASCATGPALEGATLRHGMRAAAGAVERVWIDAGTMEVRCRVIGDRPDKPVAAAGICGSGIIDAVAQMKKAGIVAANGRIDRAAAPSRIEENGKERAFVLVPADASATGRAIVVDQQDIRAMQMAKGAIHAAVRLLMDAVGVETVDRVLLCGAFGSVIDPVSALTIGLIPDFGPGCITAVGNAAGDGARLALLNRDRRREARRLARRLEYIELTVHPKFQREFAMAMYFPHMKAGGKAPR